MSSIGKRIKKRREELGITQEELATRLSYKSKSTINKIEMGINDITQSKIVSFAEALETTPAYLMGWEEIFTPDTAILHAHMTEDSEFTDLYRIWIRLNDTGRQKLMDNANDLVQIYTNEDLK